MKYIKILTGGYNLTLIKDPHLTNCGITIEYNSPLKAAPISETVAQDSVFSNCAYIKSITLQNTSDRRNLNGSISLSDGSFNQTFIIGRSSSQTININKVLTSHITLNINS